MLGWDSRSVAVPQKLPDRLREVVKIQFGGRENPRDGCAGGAIFWESVVGCGVRIRLRLAAVSHGRVGSTPTPVSALRSIRCLVSFSTIYAKDRQSVRLDRKKSRKTDLSASHTAKICTGDAH